MTVGCHSAATRADATGPGCTASRDLRSAKGPAVGRGLASFDAYFELGGFVYDGARSPTYIHVVARNI
jgi:hypothetical protein